MKQLLPLFITISAVAQLLPPSNLTVVPPTDVPIVPILVTNGGVPMLVGNYNWPAQPTNANWTPFVSTNGVDWIPSHCEWAQLPDRAGRAAGLGHSLPRRT